MPATIHDVIVRRYRGIVYRIFRGPLNWKWSFRASKEEETIGGDANNSFLAERVARAKIDERLK